MKLERSHLSLLVLVLAVGAVAAWWFTLRQDAVDANAAASSRLASARQQLSLLEAELAEARAREAEIASALAVAQREMGAIEATLPLEPDFVGLMRTVNRLTDRHALRATRIYRGPTESVGNGLRRIDYDLTTTGTFEDQVALLRDLHDQPRFLAVTRFTLHRTEGQGGSLQPTIRLEAVLTAYLRGGDEPADDDARPTPTPDAPPGGTA